jgi:hypothetical protein
MGGNQSCPSCPVCPPEPQINFENPLSSLDPSTNGPSVSIDFTSQNLHELPNIPTNISHIKVSLDISASAPLLLDFTCHDLGISIVNSLIQTPGNAHGFKYVASIPYSENTLNFRFVLINDSESNVYASYSLKFTIS